MKAWWFSLALLLGYVLTFVVWLSFPGRATFLVTGSLAVVAMAAGLKGAARSGYFVNRSDLVLHTLVIVDVALETASYEVFHVASVCIFCTPGDPSCFHSSYNFCWCSAILGVLVGGYHGWALRRVRTSETTGHTREAEGRDSETPEPASANAIGRLTNEEV